jgi:hypothetical protein
VFKADPSAEAAGFKYRQSAALHGSDPIGRRISSYGDPGSRSGFGLKDLRIVREGTEPIHDYSDWVAPASRKPGCESGIIAPDRTDSDDHRVYLVSQGVYMLA